jgi:hypothetical protein
MQLEELKKDEVFWFMLALSFLVMTSLIVGAFVPKPAHAAEIPDSLAVRAIVGEAAGEDYKGMLAIACAIRNRGTLQGVYGVYAEHNNKEPLWVWTSAKRAWKESETCDIVCGATDWESLDFRRPFWSRGMDVMAIVGKHVFYKRR